MYKNKKGKEQSGRSMIEMLGVLSVIAVLSVSGLVGYSKAIDKYKTNEIILQVTQTAQNIRDLFKSQKSYGELSSVGFRGLDNRAKMFPEKIREAGYVNSYNGWVKIESSSRFKDGDGKAFSISFSGLPGDICIGLVSHDWGNADLGKIRIRSHNIGS